MKKLLRIVLAAALSLLLTAALSGCSFRLALSPEELYQLPDLPEEYTALSSRIRGLLDYGMEYAAPISGAATQNVQLMDLDGDGAQEAVVFLRSPTEEQPLRIHIFAPVGDDYVQTAVISGSGSDIYSFNGQDLDGDGRMELLVGWQTGTRLRALTAYALQGAQPVELLRTGYTRYLAEDLDGNGTRELVVFRADEANRCAAELYAWENGLKKTSAAALSVTAEELSAGGVVFGRLRDGTTPAVFVSGVAAHDDYDVLMTDILCLRDGELTALTESEYTGITKEVFRYRDLLPADINGSGSTEIPAAVLLGGGEEAYYRIDWYAYGTVGLRHLETSTYHSDADGWYLELPSAWHGRFSVSHGRYGADESAVTFAVEGEEDVILLRITTLTGAERESRAAQDGRVILSRQFNVIYTAEVLSGDEEQGAAMAEELRSRFHLIRREWSAGDN